MALPNFIASMTSLAISSCQSSFTDFLSSIPSNCSDFAVNTVNHLIEDQVGDPAKLEQNLYRVQSVFSGCLGVGSGDFGAGDYKKKDTTTLLCVPRKVRQHIWKHLDDKTVKTLRLVCQQLRHEMDFEVGIGITLTPETFNSLWMRSVSIRSCIVRRMVSIFTLNLFAKPEKLERISFDPEVFIEADMAELILRKFRNLKQVILYTEDVAELKNMQDEITTNGISSKLISRLEDQFQMTSLDVKFDTSRWKLKWNIKMKPQLYGKSWEVQNVMGPFGLSGITRVVPQGRDLSKKYLKTVTLSIPFVQERDRFIWLQVLHAQNSLVSLTCDLNATHWKDYEKIIRKSKDSLQKLFLLNFTDMAKSFLAKPEEITDPFNWEMFEDCLELQEVTLIADTFIHSSLPPNSNVTIPLEKTPRYMSNINLTSLKCPKLRALWLENFSFSEEEVEFLKYVDVVQKTPARFELCTLKNCKIGEESVPEIHVGSRKGRNRCLECLCFGTMSYDDDDLDAFEKYTASKLAKMNDYTNDHDYELPTDMIEYFQYSSKQPAQTKKVCLKDVVAENINLIGGIAFTVWLAFAK